MAASWRDFGSDIAGVIVWFLVGLLCVYTMFLIALSSIALSVLLALGPLFFAALFFDSTRRLFEAWIAQLTNYALITVLTVLVATLLLQIVASFASQTVARGSGVNTVDSLNMVLVSRARLPGDAAGDAHRFGAGERRVSQQLWHGEPLRHVERAVRAILTGTRRTLHGGIMRTLWIFGSLALLSALLFLQRPLQQALAPDQSAEQVRLVGAAGGGVPCTARSRIACVLSGEIRRIARGRCRIGEAMKTVAAEQTLEAYFREGTSWDDDRVAAAHRGARVAWRVAGAGWVCAVTGGASLLFLMPLKRVEPFVIRVDNTSGIVDVVPVYRRRGECGSGGDALFRDSLHHDLRALQLRDGGE